MLIGTVNLNLTPTATGVTAAGKDVVKTTTNAPGYKLFISMSDSATCNKLYRNGDTTGASGYFEATSGTQTTPGIYDVKVSFFTNSAGKRFAVTPASVFRRSVVKKIGRKLP